MTITLKSILNNEQGETIQHLTARSLHWYITTAIARNPQVSGNPLHNQPKVELLLSAEQFLNNIFTSLQFSKEFSWYAPRTIEQAIGVYHGQFYNQRKEQAKALGVELPTTSDNEVSEKVKASLTEVKGFSPKPNTATVGDVEEALNELKLDGLTIMLNACIKQVDNAKAKLLQGGSGYLNPEVATYARMVQTGSELRLTA